MEIVNAQSISVLKNDNANEEEINLTILINHHKLKLIANASNVGDFCVDSTMTAYFNSTIHVGRKK